MHRCMAPRRPAISHADVASVIGGSEIDVSGVTEALPRHLDVAAEAQVGVRLRQQLRIN